jgi:Na+-driven multidrug efflux pump
VREALFLGLKTSTVVVSFAAALAVFAPVPIVRLFMDGTDAGFVRLAAGDLRVSNCMLWCIGLNVVASTYFQSVGRPRTAILLSLLRQVICLIPCIWILPYLAHVTGFCAPATAIWLSMPISDVLACVATVPSFLSHARFLARAGQGRMRRSDLRPSVPAGGVSAVCAQGGLTDGGEFGKIHNLFFDKTRKEHHGERDTTVD